MGWQRAPQALGAGGSITAEKTLRVEPKALQGCCGSFPRPGLSLAGLMPAPAPLPVFAAWHSWPGPCQHIPNHTQSCSHRQRERPSPLPPRHKGCKRSSKFSSVQKRALRVICCSLKAAEVNYRAMKSHTLILLHSPWLGCRGTLLHSESRTQSPENIPVKPGRGSLWDARPSGEGGHRAAPGGSCQAWWCSVHP